MGELPVEPGHGALGAVVDDVLDLQLVLVVGVVLSQVPELLKHRIARSVKKQLCMSVSYLRQVQTVLGQLGADEVLGYLDTVVQVSDLHICILRRI